MDPRLRLQLESFIQTFEELRRIAEGPFSYRKDGIEATECSAPRNTKWEVRRHGGRSKDQWRLVKSTDDYDKALACFLKVGTALRQGGVRLIQPDGQCVGETNAPRLRTRW